MENPERITLDDPLLIRLTAATNVGKQHLATRIVFLLLQEKKGLELFGQRPTRLTPRSGKLENHALVGIFCQ